jgi:Mn2+/Fe2+ NRAMP family transporter
VKKLAQISLGIVTGVGGYLDIGSLVTGAQAGAMFEHQLIWAVALGGICAAFLCEQGGRLAAVSGRTISDAIRERFGSTYHLVLFAVIAAVTLAILAIEIGGICVALEFATGIAFPWWSVPVAFVCWLILWKGNFAFVQYGVSAVSLVTVCFVVAAWMLHPQWHDVARGLVPTAPTHDAARYWFLTTVIIGASIAPYLFLFYSAGAAEDGWTREHLTVNRFIAAIGMGFGALISAAALVVAAAVFLPRGIRVDHYSQLAPMLIDAMGYWGFVLLVASLAIACLGTALEIALVIAYMAAQGFGWAGSQDVRPNDNARFAAVYTVAIVVATLPVVCGAEPVALTTLSMALTSLTLPLAVVPLLFVMNDPSYLAEHVNGWLSNVVVLAIIGMAFVIALATIPLEYFGS